MASKFQVSVNEWLERAFSLHYDRLKLKRTMHQKMNELFKEDPDEFDRLAYMIYEKMNLKLTEREPEWKRGEKNGNRTD